MELSNSTLEALPQNYAEQVIPLPFSDLSFLVKNFLLIGSVKFHCIISLSVPPYSTFKYACTLVCMLRKCFVFNCVVSVRWILKTLAKVSWRWLRYVKDSYLSKCSSCLCIVCPFSFPDGCEMKKLTRSLQSPKLKHLCCHLVFWSQEAVHQTVRVIFEDPGVQELLVKLYQKGIFHPAGLIFVDLLMCE